MRLSSGAVVSRTVTLEEHEALCLEPHPDDALFHGGA